MKPWFESVVRQDTMKTFRPYKLFVSVHHPAKVLAKTPPILQRGKLLNMHGI